MAEKARIMKSAGKEREYDVVGFGNALVDKIAYVNDDFLVREGLRKGEGVLVNDKRMSEIEEKLDKTKETPGGSVANTIVGAANLGLKTVFCGSVGNDEKGKVYEKKLLESGVDAYLENNDNTSTGVALTLITPDKERSFAVNLGAADKYKGEIPTSLIANAGYLHITGYELFSGIREKVFECLKTAKESNTKICIDLACASLVREKRKELYEIIKEYATLAFANAEEARAFTGKDPEGAVEDISKIVDIAVVKVGKRGAFIKTKDKLYKIPCYSANVVNTNGAGDAMTAGLLYGLVKNFDIETCGKIGCYHAARVIEREESRLDYKIKDIEKLV